MAISANIFDRCNPAIGTNNNECGALTLCDVATATPDLLEEIFMDGSQFRDMTSLLATQIEIKACGAKTNGLFDFLWANKKMMKQRAISVPLGPGNTEIAPFIMADQTSVINDEYWSVPSLTTGLALANGADTQIHVRSRHSVPLNISWFVPRMEVFLFGKTAGGSAVRAAFRVVDARSAVFGGNSTIQVDLVSLNSATLCSTTKSTVTDAFVGFLVRGVPNVADVERWCENRPGLNDKKSVAFWWGTTRWTMCTDEYYEAWFKRLKATNAYFAKFGDIDAAKRNKQYGERFQREWVNSMFWAKPYANQTLANYRSLETISSFSAATGLYVPGEGRCVGRRANPIGIYEQLCECGRVLDLQGQRLNLLELFEEYLYPLWRARGDMGIPNDVIEIYTDSFTAQQITQSMILYYDQKTAGLARFMIDTKEAMKTGNHQLGFFWTEFKLWYPNTKIRIVTHPFFDDFATAAAAEGTTVSSTGSFLWILDWNSIYPFLITSNRKVHRTGDIETLAKIDYNYACVLENPEQEVSLNSLTWGVIVECGATSLIVENFDRTKLPNATSKTAPYDAYDIT